LGLAWLYLGAQQDSSYGRMLFESALRTASEAEKKQMLDELSRLKPEYSDEVAVPRAARRFKRELSKLRSNPAYGSGTCIAGLNASASDFANPRTDIAEPVSACSMASEQAVVDAAMIRYEQYFHGLRDAEVFVRPLEKIP
jgi:hypothetical protein